MTAQIPPDPTALPKNPTELLAMQVKLLQTISESQARIERALEAIEQQQLDLAEAGVRVADLDIPFFQLMGLLIKLAVAAIPAGIIVGAIFVAVVAGLSFLGIGLRTLGR